MLFVHLYGVLVMGIFVKHTGTLVLGVLIEYFYESLLTLKLNDILILIPLRKLRLVIRVNTSYPLLHRTISKSKHVFTKHRICKSFN